MRRLHGHGGRRRALGRAPLPTLPALPALRASVEAEQASAAGTGIVLTTEFVVVSRTATAAIVRASSHTLT